MTKSGRAAAKATRTGGLLAAALLAASCGGGGGGAFTPATPPSDVCSLLTLADVQAIQPGSLAGVEQPTADTSAVGFWARDCAWDDGGTTGTSVDLVVFGATTQQGLAGIKLAASSGDVNTPVSGLGTDAHHWQDTTNNTSGVWALDGSQSVDVTAYFFTPAPPEAQFHPLVAKVLGEIK
jgi:hypothetical protein